jgi:hypothetical protein
MSIKERGTLFGQIDLDRSQHLQISLSHWAPMDERVDLIGYLLWGKGLLSMGACIMLVEFPAKGYSLMVQHFKSF